MDGPEPGPGAPRWRWRSWPGAAVAVVALGAALALALVLSSSGEHRPAAPVGSTPAGTAPTGTAPTGTAPTATPPAKLAPGAEQFGVSVNRLFNDGTYSQQQIDSQLAALHATGATIARSDALWEASEPAAPVGGVHHYDWGFDDAIAAALARHGLRWLPIIDYSAPWAESVAGSDHSPPSSAADFAAYAAAFAARYGSGGSFWRAHPDLRAAAGRHVRDLERARQPELLGARARRRRATPTSTGPRANAIFAVDPSARVIVGGLSNPGAFLPALLAAAPDLRGTSTASGSIRTRRLPAA